MSVRPGPERMFGKTYSLSGSTVLVSRSKRMTAVCGSSGLPSGRALTFTRTGTFQFEPSKVIV
jgi:hypothetical protein